MNKTPNTLRAAVIITLIATQSAALAAPSVTDSSASGSLILAVDAIELASHNPRSDTYASQYNSKDSPKNLPLIAKVDTLTKNFKNASKVFKRVTSVRYGKGQKIRARIGKSSLTFKYTRTL